MSVEPHRSNSTAGVLIRNARETRQLSREALAARIGTSVSTINRLELEDRLPRFAVTVAIARELGVSVDELAAASLAAVGEGSA